MNTHNDSCSQATTAISSDPAWFKALVDNSPNGVFALNDRQELIFVNAKMADILGYPEEEILGRNFQMFLTKESVAFVTEQYQKRQRGEEVTTYECSVRGKNGAEKIVEISGGSIRDEAGRPVTIGTMVDRSWRKEADDRLRRHEQIISTSDDLMAFIDKNYIYQAVNRALLQVWNKEEESEIVGHSVADLIGEEEFQTTVKEKLDRCLTGETIRYAHWFDFASAGQRFMDVRYQPYPDEQGQIVGVIVNSRDITERKQLQQQQDKLLAAIHQLEENIMITDPAGLIEYVNPAFEAMTGYSAQEAIGKNPRFLQSGETDSTLYRELWNRLTSGHSWQGHFVNKKKDGTLYIEEASISPIVDSQGRTTHYVAVKKDISNQLELEQQLRQKNKMEAVGTMAGGIAHNFNNNLSVILGNVELSQLKNNNPEVDELLENAKIGIMRSRDLVSQIMSYSRKSAQSLAPLQLSLIIDETLKLLGSTIPTTVRLTQTISPDSDQATINADASQIQEILLNLYSNAVHAMEEKGTLDISLDVVDLSNKELPHPGQQQPGRYARITIQDSGCGMTDEVKEKIFDPFFTTKEMHEGTGMGLATVQSIIEQHNGWIQVESSIGQGTTFELYFPVINQPQAAQPTPVKADIPHGAGKILFVDDDEILVKLGEMILTELGYQVSIMTESPEALKLFAANADYFDLVITDQTMPDLSGKELIQELLKIRPDIPTIICTGYSSQVNEEEAAKLGVKAFVMKPLDLQELAQTVRRVLDGGKEE